jgi:hypothetical protein
MPANLTKAAALLLSFDPEQDFHSEVASEFEEGLKIKFLHQLARTQTRNPDITRVMVSGGDWRFVADWFDRALSFPCSTIVRNRAIDIIEAIGYAALAGVLKGDVCMTPAVLTIEGNDIVLSGKSSKDGWRAFRRSIPGIITPRYRGDRTPCRASVVHADRFIEIALRYWPFIDGDIEAIAEEARTKGLSDNVAASAPPPPERLLSCREPIATFTVPLESKAPVYGARAGSWFTVFCPWYAPDAAMYGMINRFKNLTDNSGRRYNPATKTWAFHEEYLEQVKAIVRERGYGLGSSS